MAQLGREFNTMAGSLESAQTAVVRQGRESLALERRLREAEKLAAIGNLAAGVAHEIAAPLNVISGRAVDLGVVVEGAAEFLETELERGGVELIRDGGGSAWVEGDPDLLHQVLVNLLLNALQAMEDGGGPRRLTVRVAATAEAAIAEVEDTGAGLPPEVRQRLFEPFYTTKARGTGLGLVVARSIIEEHAGSLEADNAVMCAGARFRITLPLATAPVGVANV